MMGSAQLEIVPEDENARPSALKQEVAERLAAHRQRRARHSAGGNETHASREPVKGRQNRVAAAVAERYASTPSYRAFLAEEASRALQQATAAAEIAARNVEAVAVAQQVLLAELQKWDEPQELGTGPTVVKPAIVKASKPMAAAQPVESPVKEVSSAGITVRLYEGVGRPAAPAAPVRERKGEVVPDAAEVRALEDEIAFRQAPVFEEFHPQEPAVPLPANLLEFPRQLVASKKARPRFAEGPLREESGPGSPQLRIFEVEADQISTSPEPLSMVPEWSSIWLDAHTVTDPVDDPNMPTPAIMASLLPPQTAPMHLRVMAAGVDGIVVLMGFSAFAGVVLKIAGHVALGVPVFGAAGAVLVVLYLMYQLLFFSLNNQTVGMRFARIGLCTFSDENPSRSAMRRRVLAQAVAVLPLGLGIAWALLDDDRLGWHDRISRMYQRAY